MIHIDKNIEVKISEKNIDYGAAVKFMQNRVSDILRKNEKELIWFLNHDHIFTCGTSSNQSEILYKTNVPIINTNRGGKITYHGPGQRIVYLMIDLNNRKKDVRKFINVLEYTITCLLKKFQIESTSFSDRIGIWVTKVNGITLSKEKKIGAIGLRIKKWVTYHGLSFNIEPDLSYYKNIKACGLTDYSATSLKELNVKLSQKEFDQIFINIFEKKLKSF